MNEHYKRQRDQLRDAIIAAGGTTGYGDHGEVTVTWPVVAKEWRFIWTDGTTRSFETQSITTQAQARRQADAMGSILDWKVIGFQTRDCGTAPGPWQDADAQPEALGQGDRQSAAAGRKLGACELEEERG